ncbi:MAG: S8 family serine peptidase [Longimicrobiaceae bacterium]
MLSVLTVLTLCLGCRDNPLASDALAGTDHGGSRFVATLDCTASLRTGQLQCRETGAFGAADGPRAALLGQNQVKLRSSNVHYSDTTRIFAFDVTLQNLLTEPIGTPDGTTVTGSKVFFDTGPTVTSWVTPGDTGTIVVASANGYGNFTRSHQPYHTYAQILQPQDSTPRKRWELLMPPGANTFNFTLRVFTATPSEPKVPLAEPEGFLISEDSLAKLYALSRAVMSHQRMSGPYPNGLIVVQFDSSATQEERQAAVNVVNGRFIGGLAPFYYVQVAGDTTGVPLWTAIDRLRALPQVKIAIPDVAANVVPLYLRPNDGANWQKTDWQVDPNLATGENWGPEAVDAPMAWGCETGSDSTRIAVVDAEATHSALVAAIIASPGNDGAGMTGMMWRGHLSSTAHSSTVQLEADLKAAIRNDSIINVSIGAGYLAHIPDGHGGYTVGLRIPVANTSDDSASAAMATQWGGWMKSEEAASGHRPLYVIAAGNFAMDAKYSGLPRLAADPQLGSRVVVVAASDSIRVSLTNRALWSNPAHAVEKGSNTGTLVTLAAPGASLVSDSSGPFNVQGTSFAAPHVAGAAGLLESFDRRLSADSLKILLVQGAAAGGRTSGGYTYLDAYESLKLAAARTGAPVCGNRVWMEGGNVKIERKSLSAVSVETVGTNDPGLVEVNPMHGGRLLVATSYSTGARGFRWTGPGTWVPEAAVTISPRPGGAGFVNSLRATSHDGDTTITFYSGELRRRANGTDSVVTVVPATGTYGSSVVQYCGHEYVGPVNAPTDTARIRAYEQWMKQQGYDRNKCTYSNSYVASSRYVNDYVAAYAPRYDSALVVLAYRTRTESITGPTSCVDVNRIAVAPGDSFDIEVEYKCITRSRSEDNDGRDVYMVSRTNGARRAVQRANDPAWNVTSVGLGEDGNEMIPRYERRSYRYSETWDYNATTRHWGLMPHTATDQDCVLRYEVISNGSVSRTVPCGAATPIRTPATLAPSRAGTSHPVPPTGSSTARGRNGPSLLTRLFGLFSGRR